jgi:hypothetical protein
VFSVWTCGQESDHTRLRQTGYLSDTVRDADRVPVGLANAAIVAYSRPGDTVADPDSGAGTVLVEALRAGRHAVGLAERRWRPIAQGNIKAAKRSGAWPDAALLRGGRRGIGGGAGAVSARMAGLPGRVDLVVTALRYPRPRWGSPLDPMAALDRATIRLAGALTGCVPWLGRSGRVIVAAAPFRDRDGMLLDTLGAVLTAARTAGLVPVARCVAVTGAVRDERVVTWAGLLERRRAARAHKAGQPITLRAHQDVLILRAASGTVRTSTVSLLTAAPPAFDRDLSGSVGTSSWAEGAA